MKLALNTFLAILALAPAALARLNGHCAPAVEDGICIKRSRCTGKYGGTSYDAPFCPDDPNDVECCVVQGCPGKGANSICTWKSECTGYWKGRISPDPICPGGSDYVCCEY